MERDTIFYLLNRSSSRREFIPGMIVGGGGDDIVIQIGQQELGLVVDEEITLHFKHHGHFLNRTYRVLRVTEDVEGTRLKLEPRGAEPAECDMRSSERIPTIYESMVARLGDDAGCMVLDVSTAGLAVMGGGNYARGEVHEFEMVLDGRRYFGEVTVRSAIEIRPGRYRYGVQCNNDGPGHNLCNTLPDLWVALQIKYLEAVMA